MDLSNALRQKTEGVYYGQVLLCLQHKHFNAANKLVDYMVIEQSLLVCIFSTGNKTIQHLFFQAFLCVLCVVLPVAGYFLCYRSTIATV